MNITIRDPEASNTSFGNSSGNYKFTFNPSNQSTPTSTPASGDQFQVSAETIKAGIEKEKDFNISSSDNRIEQTSMKLYSKQLNTIKALNASGKLTEMLEQVGSNNRNNSWGYSLNQILAKAKITRNGKILTSSEELLEALKNDKNGKIKESINIAIADIQTGRSFKEKLTWANDKHDGNGELVMAVSSATILAATSPIVKGNRPAMMALRALGTLSKNVLLGSTAGTALQTRLATGLLGKAVGFALNPWVGAAVTIGIPLAKYFLDRIGASEKIAEAWESSGVGASVNNLVSSAGDNLGYQLSKFI